MLKHCHEVVLLQMGSTVGRFSSFFFDSISGKAFNQRCRRWNGNSAWLLFFYVLLDLGLMPIYVSANTILAENHGEFLVFRRYCFSLAFLIRKTLLACQLLCWTPSMASDGYMVCEHVSPFQLVVTVYSHTHFDYSHGSPLDLSMAFTIWTKVKQTGQINRMYWYKV